MIQHSFSSFPHTANKTYYDVVKLPGIWSRGLWRFEVRTGSITEWWLLGSNLALGWHKTNNQRRQLQNISFFFFFFLAEPSNTCWLALSVHTHNYIAFPLVLLSSSLIFLHNFSLKTQWGDVERKSYGCINNSYAPEGLNIMLDKNK